MKIIVFFFIILFLLKCVPNEPINNKSSFDV